MAGKGNPMTQPNPDTRTHPSRNPLDEPAPAAEGQSVPSAGPSRKSSPAPSAGSASPPLTPPEIYRYLSRRVLGQEDVLKKISVALYKHITGIPLGNILLIGNSGTGKTTIMKTIRQLYHEFPDLERFRAMVVMNANTLVDETGDVNINRLFKNLENSVRIQLGDKVTADSIQARMENATICLDEVDKISAKIAGRPNVTGIAIQQTLLTVLEGEDIHHETIMEENGKAVRVKIPLNTERMLFIAGGAFEELYDQVYTLVENRKDERRLKESTRWNVHTERLQKFIDFTLRDYMKLNDIFTFGMVPQFIARFSAIGILDDLSRKDLKQIMLTAADSPFLVSRAYFKTYGIDLRLPDDALDLITANAEENNRIGARALREVFGRVVAELEYDPFQCGYLTYEGEMPVININREMVKKKLIRIPVAT